ncbi:MAG: hypothetical protein H7Z38_19485, partial [Rubrivivax sp.]|nr:hypothetical protein [Pyrinomonadaceae bacterium]
RELIGSLARGPRPATILLTSHNLAEVEQLCERVAVISRGRIRATGTPQSLRAEQWQHERVEIKLRGVSSELAGKLLVGFVVGLEITEQPNQITVVFAREAGDFRLDRALRALLEAGAQVLSCEAERRTLLDVLESFEREENEARD